MPRPPHPPPKKSWASLLRLAASLAASTAAATGPPNGKQKLGGLPTSSVVGFSIPAAGAGSGAAGSVGKNHAALRALLSAPAADATAAAPKSLADASGSAAPTASEKTREERLSPRGLVNTGNMCFANAVLQVLVYCAPFSSLHACTRCWARRSLTSRARARGGLTRIRAGDRTMEEEGERCWARRRSCARRGRFCEFVVGVSAKKPVNGGAGGKGKGKVSPAEEQEEEPEAFIPTHVHDALKGKKRFDAMREDAEEFLGFFLDTLEKLSAVVAGLSPTSLAWASKRVATPPSADGTGRAVVEEREEEAPPET